MNKFSAFRLTITNAFEAPDYGILLILLFFIFLGKEYELLKEHEVIVYGNNTFVFAVLLLVRWLTSNFVQDWCGGTTAFTLNTAISEIIFSY